MSKIFVRERINIGRGAGKPRLAIVAVEGLDMKVYHTHVRRSELEKMAADLQAEIVYLPRSGGSEEDERQEGGGQHGGGKGRRHRHGKAQE